MAINNFNAKNGLSVGSNPINVVDNTANATFATAMTTGSMGVGTPVVATARLFVSGTSTSSDTTLAIRAGVPTPSGKLLDIRNNSGTSVASVDYLGNIFGVSGSFSGDVSITGNLTVAGTQTIINSDIINVKDNIVLLNAGPSPASTGGIYVADTVANTTGSLVWDSTTDQWKAGRPGTETTLVSGSGTNNYVTKWVGSNAVGAGVIFDDGTNVGIGTTLMDSKFVVAGNVVVSGSINPSADNNANYFLGTASKRWANVVATSFSGSLTKLSDGTTSYLQAGSNIAITTGSNGSVTIATTGLASTTAQYLTLAADASLSSERVFTPSTGLKFTDGGAGGNYTLSINDSVVATVSGTTFTGVTNHNAGLSGSLTRLTDGTSYLIAGTGITIATGSNGSVTITGNVGDITSVSAGNGLLGGGTSGDVSLSINNSVVATISGSTFTGAVKFNSGLSGSLTQLVDGTSYLIAGSNIQISTGSNGSVNISSPNAATNSSAYITVGNDSTLTNERALTAGTGLKSVDGGANGAFTLSINDSVVATVSGTTFTGVTNHNAGLSGSLTKLTDGTSYLIAGSNVQITSGSNGSVTFSTTGLAPLASAYLTVGNDSTLTNERSIAVGTGLLANDGGANGSYTLSINNSVVATVSGTTFTGATRHNAGLSGSLTKLTDGTSYLVAGSNVQIVTGSNGSVTITSTASGASYVAGSNTQVQFNDGGTFGADADFTFDKNNNLLKATNISGSLTGSNVLAGQIVLTGTGGVLSGSNLFFWDNTNVRVGLGTSSTATHKLTVYEDVSSTLSIGVINPSINSSATSRLHLGAQGGDWNIENLRSGGVLSFKFNTTEYLRINNVGNVGIGTNDSNGNRLAISGGNLSVTGSILPGATTTYDLGSATYRWRDLYARTGSFSGDVTISGDLTVNGTQFIVNTQVVEIEDNAILLNAGPTPASTGGIYVADTTTGITGSLLWDAATDQWKAGKLGSEVTLVSGSGTTNYLSKWTGANGLGNSVIHDDGTNVGIGTTATGDKLAVNGSMSVTGSVQPGSDVTYTLGNTTKRWLNVVSNALTGSLTKLSDGTTDYLQAGSNIAIATGSNGAVTISTTGLASTTAQYLTLAVDASLSSERVFAPSTGLKATDGGAGGNYTLTINDSIVATVSGTTFTGVTRHNAGLSGSLTKLTDGTSYLIAGSNIQIATGSTGAVTITSTATGATYVAGSTTQVQFNDGGTFGADADFTFDKSSNLLRVTNISGSLTGSNVLAGQVVVAGTGGLLSGSNNFWWDNSNYRVGIGTNTGLTTLLYLTGSASDGITIRTDTGPRVSYQRSNDGQGWSSGYDTTNNGFVIAQSPTSLTTTQRLFINSGGYVGVGTVTPLARFYITGSSTASDTTFLVREGVVSPTGGAGVLNVQNSAGTSLLFVSGSGNVGIGSTTPTTNLDVSGIINASTGYRAAGSATSGNVLRGNGTNFVSAQLAYSDLSGAPTVSGNATYISKFTGTSTIGNSALTESSSVVNITSTSSNAELRLNNSFSRVAFIDGAGGFAGGYNVKGNSGPFTSLQHDSLGSLAAIWYSTNGILFYASTSQIAGSTPAEVMRIANAGNVGIGTNTYTARFFVSGSSTASTPTTIIREGVVSPTGGAGVLDVQNSAGTSLLFVSGSGNVGIGTNTPQDKAQVYGDLRVGLTTPGAFITLGDEGSTTKNNGIYRPASSNTVTIGAYSYATINVSANTLGNQTERLRVDSSGNVGIGTNTYSARLHVSGSSTASTPTMIVREGVVSPTAGAGTFDVQNSSGTSLLFVSGSGAVGIGTTVSQLPSHRLHVAGKIGGGLYTDSSLEFKTDGTTELKANSTLKLGYSLSTVIDSSGQVGINTTVPAAKLDFGLTTGKDIITLYNNGANNQYGFGISANTLELYTSTSGVMTFNKRSGASYTETMRIDSSGNVGIGTNATTDKLAVNGSMSVTGSLLPGVDNTYDLGSSTKRWANVYANNVVASGSLGPAYTSPSSTSGTTALFDTVSVSTDAAVYELMIIGNPNSSASTAYRDVIYGKVIIGTGNNGATVRNYIQFIAESPAPRSLYGAAGNGPLAADVVYLQAGNEFTDIAQGGTATLRVKITGYAAGFVGNNTTVRLKQLA